MLNTYDAERRPIADRTVAQALARLQAWFKDPSGRLPPPEPIRDDTAVIFGYRYPAGAFVDDHQHDADAADLLEDPRAPSGRPGSRAPHFVATDRWVLVSGPPEPNGIDWSTWIQRSAAAQALGIIWHGVRAGGAVLIRPDGFIAWRQVTGADGPNDLEHAIERIRCRR